MSLIAPPQNGLSEVLRTHGVVRAVVIDDAFDVNVIDTVTAEEYATFGAALRSNSAIAEDLARVGVDPAAVLKKDTATLLTLVTIRETLIEARPYVEALFAQYLEHRELVDDLVHHLKTLALDVITLGADQKVPDDLNAQLAFIDFYLDDQVPADLEPLDGAKDPSQNARGKARAVYDRTNAFIFLMSSREEVSHEEAAFRKKAKLLRGYFQFQSKEALSQERLLFACLSALPLAADFRHTLHAFIDCLERRSKAITESFVDEVRDLGLEDYALLRQLSLNKDGHPFGDYIIRLFGNFMTALVLEDQDLAAFVSTLDATSFEAFLPIRAEPSATLGKIYLASLTETLREDIVNQMDAPGGETMPAATPQSEETPLEAAVSVAATTATPALLAIEFGNLFVKDASSPIYAVMNPACDLAKGSERNRQADDAVLLLPGSLRHLHESFAGTRAPTMFTPMYVLDGIVYRIDWDYRRILTIAHKLVPSTLLANGYRCERRLQLGPALELQQHFASSISRVGLPVQPPICRSLDASLYCRCVTGEWKQLGEDLKAAIVALHMRDKDQFVITTSANSSMLTTIRAHLEKLQTVQGNPEWNGAGVRAQYVRQLEQSVTKWSAQLPFLRVPGSLPGGREKEKTWNKKSLVTKERLGVARDSLVLTAQDQDVDAALVFDMSPLLFDQATSSGEFPREMDEG